MIQALTEIAEIEKNNPNIKFDKIVIKKSINSFKEKETKRLNGLADFGRVVTITITRNDEKSQK